MTQSEVQAMVLAAGLGTRLWPLTCDRAKPAVPFLGRPLIGWVLELLERHGIRRAVVNTHHLPGSIHRALAESPPGGISLSVSHETEILGTAGGIAKAIQDGLLDPDRPVLVINAKLYTDLDLGAAIRAHRASGALVSMALRTNVEREAFREVLIEGDRVIGFGARVPTSPSPLLFTGVHILEPAVLRSLEVRFSDTVADVYPPLIERRLVAAHVDDRGRWWEMSTLERYLGLHLRAAELHLAPDVVLSAGARIDPRAQVERSVLWPGAFVPEGCDLSEVVLGSGVSLEPGTRLERTIVVRRDLGGTEVGVATGARGHVEGEHVLVPLGPLQNRGG